VLLEKLTNLPSYQVLTTENLVRYDLNYYTYFDCNLLTLVLPFLQVGLVGNNHSVRKRYSGRVTFKASAALAF